VKPTEPYLDLEDDDLSTEKLDLQVQKAQEQLLALKRQQEQIEKQKRELEELSRRQEMLQQGRSEMLDKFTRSLVIVEREVLETQKRVELLREIDESFRKHVEILEAIDPKTWDPADLNRELTKALGAVDDARAEYQKTLPKIQPDATVDELTGEELSDSHSAHDFFYWLKAGFAFTLPLLVLGTIYLVVALFR